MFLNIMLEEKVRWNVTEEKFEILYKSFQVNFYYMNRDDNE